MLRLGAFMGSDIGQQVEKTVVHAVRLDVRHDPFHDLRALQDRIGRHAQVRGELRIGREGHGSSRRFVSSIRSHVYTRSDVLVQTWLLDDKRGRIIPCGTSGEGVPRKPHLRERVGRGYHPAHAHARDDQSAAA